MKPSSNFRRVSVLIIIILLGILAFAIVKSSHYIAPKQPVITQQSIKDKLSNNEKLSRKDKAVKPNTPPAAKSNGTAQQGAQQPPAQRPSTPQPQPANQPPKLSNSGPGEVFVVFAAATVAGTAASYIFQIARHRSLNI